MKTDYAVGRALKLLRSSHEMTQGDLAEKMGISKLQMVKIERGQRELSHSYTTRLAATFGLTIVEFYKLIELLDDPKSLFKRAVGGQ